MENTIILVSLGKQKLDFSIGGVAYWGYTVGGSLYGLPVVKDGDNIRSALSIGMDSYRPSYATFQLNQLFWLGRGEFGPCPESRIFRFSKEGEDYFIEGFDLPSSVLRGA